MNAKALTILAVLAVAAVAVVGAGYAYYWGQTQIDDNQVDVEYLAISTDMAALDVDVGFNTTYNQAVADDPSTTDVDEEKAASFTITPTGSTFVTIGGKNVTPITRDLAATDEGAATRGYAKGESFTIQAPIATAANSYEFQVIITDVTLGTNAVLYFGISNAATTAPETLYEFQKIDGGYVAVLPAAELTQTGESTGLYSLEQFGFVYLEVKDEVVPDEGIQVADVKTVKCAIDQGEIIFQALKHKIASTTSGLVVTFSEIDGFTPSVSGATYNADAKTLTFNAAGTYLVKFTAGSDVFYKEFTVNSA